MYKQGFILCSIIIPAIPEFNKKYSETMWSLTSVYPLPLFPNEDSYRTRHGVPSRQWTHAVTHRSTVCVRNYLLLYNVFNPGWRHGCMLLFSQLLKTLKLQQSKPYRRTCVFHLNKSEKKMISPQPFY